MKKLIKILLIVLMFLSFNINILNVKAENDNSSLDGGENQDPSGGENDDPSNDEPSEEEKLKSDATLKYIIVDGDKQSCDGIECTYTINDSEVEKVKITFETTNPNATTDKESINESILEGKNIFNVKVTSEDKTKTNTYTITIIKKSLSTKSTLKSLSVNGVEIELKEGTLKYQTTVSHAIRKLDIIAIPTDDTCTIKDFEDNKATFDFLNNTKEIKIQVKSEAGVITTYTLTVNKRGEADTTLRMLNIKNHKIEFSPEITDYEIKVLKNVTRLEIEAKANSSAAKINIINPKLQVGENIVRIEVVNDEEKTTYEIKVTKIDEDDKTLANLKSLTIEGYQLDFKQDKYEYDLRVGDVNYLLIDAIPKLDDAKVDITGNLDLENGSIIKIKVNYDEEYQNVYKINIIKDGKPIVNRVHVSKKAIVAVMGFDIVSMIIVGIFQIKNKNTKKNNKTRSKDTDIDII